VVASTMIPDTTFIYIYIFKSNSDTDLRSFSTLSTHWDLGRLEAIESHLWHTLTCNAFSYLFIINQLNRAIKTERASTGDLATANNMKKISKILKGHTKMALA
jgi:hypothetical protein